ncbi:MAG: LacI family DNA-binding transcriptional regulator [Spirochaetales bacterium]|nr:LacI family DNA-binding transcriptional regulator [Spirochaetales bacterium]
MNNGSIPTMAEVAARAGVSIATVSRYLNGIKIKPKLVDKVKKAIDELDYKPNQAARSIRGSRSHTIGMILPQLEHPYFSAVLEGATQEARKHDQTILVASSQGKRDIEHQIIHQFSRSIIDGLIYTPVATGDSFIEEDSFRNLPVIITGRSPSVYPEFNHVFQNTRAGGYLSTNYLLSLGHKKIAFFASFWEPICESNSIMECLTLPGAGVYSSLERFRGYLDALKEADVEYDSNLVVICSYGFKDGQQAARDLLSRCIAFDAIVTASDTVACGVINTLRAQGIQIPSDVSILGYGNLEIGSIITPQLTSIHQDMFALGVESVKAFNALLNGEALSNKILDVKLVVRDSTSKKL